MKTTVFPKRKPRIDGVTRREKIVSFLRENPRSGKTAIARGVGLATHRHYSPALDSHLSVLEAEGRVRQVGRGWEAA